MVDRAALEAFLQSRGIEYDAGATDDELAASVQTLSDAEHARYLEHYDPVITRLPAAVGTSPEQPDEPADDSVAAPPSTDDVAAPDTEVAASVEAPAPAVVEPPAPPAGTADPAPAASEEPPT